MMPRFTVGLIFFASLAFASLAQATILADWELDELVRRSDRVVIGTVIAQRTVDAAPGSITNLLTESTVRVEETLRGPHARELIITQLGGKKNGRSTWIEGDARLIEGRTMVLFTYLHPDGRRYLTGMSLGALFADGDVLSSSSRGEAAPARVPSLAALRASLQRGPAR